LAKIIEIGTDNGNSVSAGHVRHPATTGRRRIWHHGHRRRLEEIRQLLLVHVSGEFDRRISFAFFLHGLDVTCGLRMIAAANHQSGMGQCFRYPLKGFNHQFQPLVGSPFSKSQNAMLGISTPGKIGELGFAGENAMRTEMHIVAAIFFMQNVAISGHQYGYGICQEKHSSRKRAGNAISSRVTNPCIFQVHSVHQMMERDVGVAAGKPRKHGSQKSAECNKGIPAEGAEKQIKPDDVGL
jgi:hypothetical protein